MIWKSPTSTPRLELRKSLLELSAMIDDGRDPVAGCPQEPAAVLQRAGLGDLQMLQGPMLRPNQLCIGDGQDQVGFGGGGPSQVGVGNS